MKPPLRSLPFPEVATPEQTLAEHGLTPEDLRNICYAIAHQYAQASGSQLDVRIEDLAQHLAEVACRRIPTFDRNRGTIRTWLWANLVPACKDWHRKKAEGFGDRRYGHENRLVLTDHRTMEHADPTGEYDYERLEQLADEERQEKWAKAAEKVDWPVGDWIAITLDKAAGDLLEPVVHGRFEQFTDAEVAELRFALVAADYPAHETAEGAVRLADEVWDEVRKRDDLLEAA